MRRTGIAAFIAFAGLLATAGPANAALGHFGVYEPYDTGGYVYGADVGDINHDGIPDMVVANDAYGGSAGDHISLLYGRNSGIFNESGMKKIKDPRGPEGIAIGHFNGDKYLDFAAADYNDNISKVSIFLGNRSGVPKLAHTYKGGTGNFMIEAADLNGDGKLDLVTGNFDIGAGISVLLGNGDGSFKAHVDYPDPGSTGNLYGLALGKVNAGKRLDAVMSDGSGLVTTFLGRKGGKFAPPTSTSSGTTGPGAQLVLGKFDPGSTLDAVVPDYSGDQVYFLPGNGDGSFGTPVPSPSVGSPNGIATADFNQDGKLDLAVGQGSSTGVRILNGVGDGTFTFHVSTNGTDKPEFVQAAKFDGDAGPDVLAGTDSGVNAWLNPPKH